MNGPSGHGCDDAALEITSGPVYTTSIPLVEQYDTIKVNAVLDWIHGLNLDIDMDGKRTPAARRLRHLRHELPVHQRGPEAG